MRDMKENRSRHGGPNGNINSGPGPYWRRAHRDWRFWVGALLMATALVVYVMSEDLSSFPRSRPQHPSSGYSTR